MTRLAVAAVTAAAVLVAASPALTATPESGSVSKSAPKATWSGETDQSYFGYVLFFYAAEDAPCEAPRCDTYTLEVKDAGGTLEITAATDGAGADSVVAMRITQPDGTRVFEQGEDGKPHKMRFSNAAAGSYVVDVVNNSLGPETYKGTATLAFGDAAPAPVEATPTPTPSGSPPAQQQQQGGSQPTQPSPPPATTASIKAPSASAKKLKRARKITFKATTSAPLSAVTVRILKGAKASGTAKLARLEGSASIPVKLKRGLKAGRYTVLLEGTDGAGRQVTARASLRVRR